MSRKLLHDKPEDFVQGKEKDVYSRHHVIVSEKKTCIDDEISSHSHHKHARYASKFKLNNSADKLKKSSQLKNEQGYSEQKELADSLLSVPTASRRVDEDSSRSRLNRPIVWTKQSFDEVTHEQFPVSKFSTIREKSLLGNDVKEYDPEISRTCIHESISCVKHDADTKPSSTKYSKRIGRECFQQISDNSKLDPAEFFAKRINPVVHGEKQSLKHKSHSPTNDGSPVLSKMTIIPEEGEVRSVPDLEKTSDEHLNDPMEMGQRATPFVMSSMVSGKAACLQSFLEQPDSGLTCKSVDEIPVMSKKGWKGIKLKEKSKTKKWKKEVLKKDCPSPPASPERKRFINSMPFFTYHMFKKKNVSHCEREKRKHAEIKKSKHEKKKKRVTKKKPKCPPQKRNKKPEQFIDVSIKKNLRGLILHTFFLLLLSLVALGMISVNTFYYTSITQNLFLRTPSELPPDERKPKSSSFMPEPASMVTSEERVSIAIEESDLIPEETNPVPQQETSESKIPRTKTTITNPTTISTSNKNTTENIITTEFKNLTKIPFLASNTITTDTIKSSKSKMLTSETIKITTEDETDTIITSVSPTFIYRTMMTSVIPNKTVTSKLITSSRIAENITKFLPFTISNMSISPESATPMIVNITSVMSPTILNITTSSELPIQMTEDISSMLSSTISNITVTSESPPLVAFNSTIIMPFTILRTTMESEFTTISPMTVNITTQTPSNISSKTVPLESPTTVTVFISSVIPSTIPSTTVASESSTTAAVNIPSMMPFTTENTTAISASEITPSSPMINMTIPSMTVTSESTSSVLVITSVTPSNVPNTSFISESSSRTLENITTPKPFTIPGKTVTSESIPSSPITTIMTLMPTIFVPPMFLNDTHVIPKTFDQTDVKVDTSSLFPITNTSIQFESSTPLIINSTITLSLNNANSSNITRESIIKKIFNFTNILPSVIENISTKLPASSFPMSLNVIKGIPSVVPNTMTVTSESTTLISINITLPFSSTVPNMTSLPSNLTLPFTMYTTNVVPSIRSTTSNFTSESTIPLHANNTMPLPSTVLNATTVPSESTAPLTFYTTLLPFVIPFTSTVASEPSTLININNTISFPSTIPNITTIPSELTIPVIINTTTVIPSALANRTTVMSESTALLTTYTVTAVPFILPNTEANISETAIAVNLSTATALPSNIVNISFATSESSIPGIVNTTRMLSFDIVNRKATMAQSTLPVMETTKQIAHSTIVEATENITESTPSFNTSVKSSKYLNASNSSKGKANVLNVLKLLSISNLTPSKSISTTMAQLPTSTIIGVNTTNSMPKSLLNNELFNKFLETIPNNSTFEFLNFITHGTLMSSLASTESNSVTAPSINSWSSDSKILNFSALPSDAISDGALWNKTLKDMFEIVANNSLSASITAPHVDGISSEAKACTNSAKLGVNINCTNKKPESNTRHQESIRISNNFDGPAILNVVTLDKTASITPSEVKSHKSFSRRNIFGSKIGKKSGILHEMKDESNTLKSSESLSAHGNLIMDKVGSDVLKTFKKVLPVDQLMSSEVSNSVIQYPKSRRNTFYKGSILKANKIIESDTIGWPLFKLYLIKPRASTENTNSGSSRPVFKDLMDENEELISEKRNSKLNSFVLDQIDKGNVKTNISNENGKSNSAQQPVSDYLMDVKRFFWDKIESSSSKDSGNNKTSDSLSDSVIKELVSPRRINVSEVASVNDISSKVPYDLMDTYAKVANGMPKKRRGRQIIHLFPVLKPAASEKSNRSIRMSSIEMKTFTADSQHNESDTKAVVATKYVTVPSANMTVKTSPLRVQAPRMDVRPFTRFNDEITDLSSFNISTLVSMRGSVSNDNPSVTTLQATNLINNILPATSPVTNISEDAEITKNQSLTLESLANSKILLNRDFVDLSEDPHILRPIGWVISSPLNDRLNKGIIYPEEEFFRLDPLRFTEDQEELGDLGSLGHIKHFLDDVPDDLFIKQADIEYDEEFLNNMWSKLDLTESIRRTVRAKGPLDSDGLIKLCGKTLEETASITDFWRYARTTMLHLLYSHFWSTFSSAETHTKESHREYFYDNQLIGVPRVRQVRVRNDSCTIHPDVSRFFDKCYGEYSIYSEETRPIPNEGPKYLTPTAWEYTSHKVLKAREYWGEVALYGGGGYYVDLDVNDNKTLKILNELHDGGWLSKATRAVFVDFAIYNVNVNLFCICKIVVEFPAAGGAIPKADFVSLKLFRYLNTWDFFILGCEVALGIFILLYTVEAIIDWKAMGFAFLKKFSSWISLIVILLGYVWIFFSIARYLIVDEFTNRLYYEKGQYINFTFVRDIQIYYNYVIALFVFFSWLLMIKYLSVTQTMAELQGTLRRSARNILGFSLLFLIYFFAFAEVAFLLFGDQVRDYRNIWTSTMALMQTVTGQFRYREIQEANQFLAPIFFLFFIFFVVFILLNMFIAIITNSYASVKSEVNVQKYRTKEYVKKAGLNFLGCCCCGLDKKLQKFDSEKIQTYAEIKDLLRKSGFSENEIEVFLSKYKINVNLVMNETENKRIVQDLELVRLDFNETVEQAQLNNLTRRFDRLNDRVQDLQRNLQPVIDKVDLILHRLVL